MDGWVVWNCESICLLCNLDTCFVCLCVLACIPLSRVPILSSLWSLQPLQSAPLP